MACLLKTDKKLVQQKEFTTSFNEGLWGGREGEGGREGGRSIGWKRRRGRGRGEEISTSVQYNGCVCSHTPVVGHQLAGCLVLSQSMYGCNTSSTP